MISSRRLSTAFWLDVLGPAKEGLDSSFGVSSSVFVKVSVADEASEAQTPLVAYQTAAARCLNYIWERGLLVMIFVILHFLGFGGPTQRAADRGWSSGVDKERVACCFCYRALGSPRDNPVTDPCRPGRASHDMCLASQVCKP